MVAKTIKFKTKETDEQIIERIGKRFSILDDMTKACINGDVRAMIVVGPPGVGKSYGVEKQLEKAGIYSELGSRPKPYDVVKGAMSAIGLYCKLFNYKEKDNVLVFDDCDSVLQDELSLNILKAALDSKKTRKICWNTDSYKLRNEGVPDTFNFEGSAIFITNVKFENVKSKKLQDHLEAVQSRCHYLDLTLDTSRDKLLRIKQIAGTGALFQDYDFNGHQVEEMLDFMTDNQDNLNELSLRMALKIADLRNISNSNWRELAEVTCMKRR
jgi:predicted AAA+ superfamily ATPase